MVGRLKRIVAGSNRHRRESFPCGNGPFPCGNEPIPHGKIRYRYTRLILHVVAGGHFHMEMTRSHIEMTSSHVGMTRSHTGMSRRRLSACEKPIAQPRSDMGRSETRRAPRQSQQGLPRSLLGSRQRRMDSCRIRLANRDCRAPRSGIQS